MEYFCLSDFRIFVGVLGFSVLEIHSYEQILLWGKLISTLQQNEAQRLKNNYFFSHRIEGAVSLKSPPPPPPSQYRTVYRSCVPNQQLLH